MPGSRWSIRWRGRSRRPRPIIRSTGAASDPDFATQTHADHLRALERAVAAALVEAGIEGSEVASIAIDTTGSTVVMIDAAMQPLDDYYVWCDHRAKAEAEEITALARAENLEAIKWCGGVYSHEWGWAKLLHWLRHNPDKRDRLATVVEHCDMMVATLDRRHRSRGRSSAAPARRGTNGCGIRSGGACRRRISSRASIRSSTGYGTSSKGGTAPPTRRPAR